MNVLKVYTYTWNDWKVTYIGKCPYIEFGAVDCLTNVSLPNKKKTGKLSFKAEVLRQIKSLSLEKTVFFAGLCAIRALPFLCAENGYFLFWKDTEKQKHLHSIFNAIDAALKYQNKDSRFAVDTAARAIDAAYAANAYAANAYAAARAAAYAADAAAYDADRVAIDVYDAATRAAYAAGSTKSSLVYIILNDIEYIKTNRLDLLNNDIAVYGDVWSNFQDGLSAVGCGYWAKFYADLFANRFVVDQEELERRLSVPVEIMARGAADVASYVLKLREHGARRINEARVIILGNKGSGKTSLARKLKDTNAKMPKKEESTEGVDIIHWELPKKEGDDGVNVHIWDFAGHVITHAVHPCFMSARCLYILVVDGRTGENSRIEYWLEQIRNYGKSSPVLILVNVSDEHRVELPVNTLKNVFPSIVNFYEVNIKEDKTSLEAFRRDVMNFLRDKPLWKIENISIPAYGVKNALREKFVQGNNFITPAVFNQICKDNGIKTEERKQLLLDLRDLGICLWYDNVDMGEVNDMVLNPRWISHGIYRLIDWGSKKNKFILSASDYREAFTGDDAVEYPVEKANFLFNLMKIYKLAFSKDDAEIFVPLLRPADRPDKGLPVFTFGTRLRMEYCANQALPPYTVARLAVIHSDVWDKDVSWRFGAVLCWEDTKALVEESEHARSVTVHVEGPKQKECISMLRDTLNNIFKDYESSSPELKYEIRLPEDQLRGPHKIDSEKLLISEAQITGNARAGQKVVLDITLKGINLLADPQLTIKAYAILPENNSSSSRRDSIVNNLIANAIWYALGIICLIVLATVGILNWEEIISFVFR